MKAFHEKPWYISTLRTFVSVDIPRALGKTPGAFARDVYTLEQRLACEGESFVTKTLPKLGKAIDLALQGHTPLSIREFGRISKRDARPAFLQAVTVGVFQESGWVLENPCITSIRLLRQLCFWCKKIEKGYTDELLQQAVHDFKTVDSLLPDRASLVRNGTLGSAKALVENLFEHARRDSVRSPRHGPGAVASGASLVEKRRLRHCFRQLERVFRPIPWLFSLRDAAENYERITGRFQCEYGLSRTEFVEKDSGGPRTIGLEQEEYMWIQQAIKDFLYDYIENYSLAKGFINFTDQSINRELTRDWASWITLDMSKASDRVSYALVEALFSGVPWLWAMLDASRSPGTILPGGEILWFRKFAPMGSAVCFPVEAIVFWTLAVTVLHRRGMPLKLACRSVYVYGDDLIVPHGFYTSIAEEFEMFGLKFNTDKCCVHGKFRESCGLDAFGGEEVTPVRLRKVYPKNSTYSLYPIVEHANALMRAGYRSAALEFRLVGQREFPFLRKIPVNPRDDLPFYTWYDPWSQDRLPYKYTLGGMCSVKGWTFKPKRMKCRAADEGKYLRESLSRGGPVGREVWKSSYRNKDGHREYSHRTLDKRFAGTAVLTKFWVQPPEGYFPAQANHGLTAGQVRSFEISNDIAEARLRASHRFLIRRIPLHALLDLIMARSGVLLPEEAAALQLDPTCH